MTIQEAIKSGKPFKRELWTVWYFLSPSGRIYSETEDGTLTTKVPITIRAVDILANDWEVKE